MPIPSGDLELVRESGSQVTLPVINYWPKEIVASGSITATPTTYPIGQVSVSWTAGTYTNIKVGQLWVIRQSGNIVSYGVVRLAISSSSVLFIDGKSRGDAGIAVAQEFAITAGQTIEVYTIKPTWSLLSRIVSGGFYKKFDVPYDGSGSNPNPVVNIGAWRQAYADTVTSRATFTFSNSRSFTWLTKTLTAYLWTLPVEAVIISGSTTSANITFTLPQGFFTVSCRVTDSGGAVQSGTRPIWVNGPDYPALSDRYAYAIGSDSQSRKRRTQSLTFYGDLDINEFLPGFPLHYAEQSWFDGQEISAGVLVDTFSGYSTDQNNMFDLPNGEKAMVTDSFSPWSWFEEIPMVSQAIVEVAAPSNWTDIVTGLGTPDFIGWYILHHHSTYLDMFDYEPLLEVNSFSLLPNPVRKLNWGLNGSTLAEYLNKVASAIGGNIGCASDGTLYLRRDPNIEETAFRDALDVRMTITINENTGIADLSENVQIPIKLLNNSGQLRLFTLCYDGTTTTAFGSIAPGFTQMQAPGSSDQDSVIVKPETNLPSNTAGWEAGGQDKTNRLSGHFLAKANKPTPEIGLALNRNMDFFDPAKMLWSRLSIPATWNPQKTAISTRILPTTVERSWEQGEDGAFYKSVKLGVEPESYGQPGETYILDKGGGSIYAPQIPPVITGAGQDDSTFGRVTPFLIAVNRNGRIGRTMNGENWLDIRGNMQGLVQDYDFNYFSDYITSGYSSGDLGAWAITADRNSGGDPIGEFRKAEIWYSPNVLAPAPVWTKLTELGGPDDIQGACRLVASSEHDGFVAATINNSHGTYILRSSDGGATWLTITAGEERTGATINIPADMALLDKRIYTSGWQISSSSYKLVIIDPYPSTTQNYAASCPQGDIPWPMVKTNTEITDVYATMIQEAVNTATSTVTRTVSGASPVTNYTGDLNSTNVTASQEMASPGSALTFVGGNGVGPTPTDPDDCIGSPHPPITHHGWQVGTHFGTPAAHVFPGYIASAPSQYKRGSPQAMDGDYAYVEFIFSGTVTIAQGEQFVYWMVTSQDWPDASACGLAGTIFSLVQRWDFFDKDGNLIQSGLAAGIGNIADPDGQSSEAYGLFNVYYRPGFTPGLETHIITATFYHTGSFFGSYPTFFYGPAIVTTAVTDLLTPKFYRVSSINSGSPTYHDITPVDNQLPANPYSLSIDSFHPHRLFAAFTTPPGIATSSINKSLDQGVTWSEIAPNTYTFGITRSGDNAIAWGDSRVWVTIDGFANYQDVFGDWAISIDEGGIFRAVKGILSDN